MTIMRRLNRGLRSLSVALPDILPDPDAPSQ
jgi:hypothetical protein